MSEYLRKGDLKSILNRLADRNPGNLGDINGYMAHCLDSYDLGGDSAADIHQRYGKAVRGFPISEAMAIGGGVHDIGRPLRKNQQGHELRGAKFLRQHGVEAGIARNQQEADMYADWIQRHFLIYDEWKDSNNTGLREEYPEITDPEGMLLPSAWPHLVIVAADLGNVGGRIIPYKERLDDLERRYPPETTVLGPVIKAGRPRVERYCKLVEKFRKGELSEKEIEEFALSA